MTADLTSASPEQTGGEPKPVESITLDSPGRTGLSTSDLAEVLTALLYRYNPGNETQRTALQTALLILEARDFTTQNHDHKPFETREEIGAIALETHAARLQKDSGFLTRDAPGVAEARAFADELRSVKVKTPATVAALSGGSGLFEEERPNDFYEEVVMTSAGPLTVKVTGYSKPIQQIQLFDRTGSLRFTHPVQAYGRYLDGEYIRELFEKNRPDPRSHSRRSSSSAEAEGS